ncbi:MAG: methyl-accepting chemotaxis protein [Rhodoferax sp.]
MNFTSHWGIARRLYLASSLLIAALVLVANAAWISLTSVDDLSRQVAVNSVPGPDQQALAQIGLQARGARTRVSVMVVAVALGLLAFSWYISHLLLRRVATAQHMAERVRAGDLSRVAIDKTHDEFHPLLLALGSMQSALMNVVRNVRHGAESVATASVEIAQGNRDLSRRTEEQAVALEETAESMAQLDGIVRKNADGALLARQLAQDASAVAGHAGDVVAQVMDTMQGIDDSARNIVDIIQVIDGIAFQTNILALNAAVEAARAGEQGRGFAVVASEVRSLAQRSADAARQIKQLVNTSVARAGRGSALATDAGNAMQQVVSAIARVTRIMEEISAASLQQSSSLSHVSDTVTHMGRSTQQNAALVEQISAAADSLGTQAQAQVQGVAVFRLDRTEERDATPVPGAKMPVVLLSGEFKQNRSLALVDA